MLAAGRLYTVEQIFEEAAAASQFAHVPESEIRSALENGYKPFTEGGKAVDDDDIMGGYVGQQYIECLRLGAAPILFFPEVASQLLFAQFGSLCCLCGEKIAHKWWQRSSYGYLFAKKRFSYTFTEEGKSYVDDGPSCLCQGCDVAGTRRYKHENAVGKIIEKLFSSVGRERIKRNKKNWDLLRFDPRNRGSLQPMLPEELQNGDEA